MMDKRVTTRAADYLNGESPRARGEAKKRRVLIWLLRWGYSSADIIRQVAGQNKNGYALSLVRASLLREVKTVGRIPTKLYVLTRDGLEIAIRHSDSALHYPEIDPVKINQGQMGHYLKAQSVTINAIKQGKIADYKTERMFAEGKAGEKRSDVIWVTKNLRNIGVEIELSGKWNRALDQFVYRLMNALSGKSNQAVQIYEAAIVTESESIRTRYKKAMEPGATINIWEKNPSRGTWETKKKLAVPDSLSKKVYFFLHQ
jgi:hypothetical protein